MLIQALLKSRAVRYSLIIIAIALGIYYWFNWSMDMRDQLKEITEKHDTLLVECEGYLNRDKNVKDGFGEIDQSQIDLLCAARYGGDVEVTPGLVFPRLPVPELIISDILSPIPEAPESSAPAAPEVKTVVVTKEKIVYKPELKPHNEGIAIMALDNSWKAYCLAIEDKDDICKGKVE